MKKNFLGILLKAGKIKLFSFGHLYRCIEIAKKLKKKFNILFIINNNQQAKKILELNKFSYLIYKKLDEKILLNIFVKAKVKNLIIDLFTFVTQRFINQIKKKKIKTILLDDFPKRNINADIVFNYSINKDYKKKYLKSKKVFFGPRYLPIDFNLNKLRNASKFKKKIKKILIFFGGSDILDLSERYLNIFKNNNNDYKINLVLGPGNSIKKYQRLKKNFKCKNIKINYFIKDLNLLIYKSDLIICSGGYTMYKSLYLKKICIVIPTSPNEKKIFNYAKKIGIIGNYNFSKNIPYKFINKIILDENKRKNIFQKLDKVFNRNSVKNFYNNI